MISYKSSLMRPITLQPFRRKRCSRTIRRCSPASAQPSSWVCFSWTTLTRHKNNRKARMWSGNTGTKCLTPLVLITSVFSVSLALKRNVLHQVLDLSMTRTSQGKIRICIPERNCTLSVVLTTSSAYSRRGVNLGPSACLVFTSFYSLAPFSPN